MPFNIQLRFLFFFCLYFAGFFLLFVSEIPLWGQSMNEYLGFTALTAKLTYYIAGATFAPEAQYIINPERFATGGGYLLSSPLFSMEVLNGCNGLTAIMIFVSGVLAFPARWWQKMLGVLAGFICIATANALRLVLLFYVGIYYHSQFQIVHDYFTQSFIIFFSTLLYAGWLFLVTRNRRGSDEKPV